MVTFTWADVLRKNFPSSCHSRDVRKWITKSKKMSWYFPKERQKMLCECDWVCVYLCHKKVKREEKSVCDIAMLGWHWQCSALDFRHSHNIRNTYTYYYSRYWVFRITMITIYVHRRIHTCLFICRLIKVWALAKAKKSRRKERCRCVRRLYKRTSIVDL